MRMCALVTHIYPKSWFKTLCGFGRIGESASNLRSRGVVCGCVCVCLQERCARLEQQVAAAQTAEALKVGLLEIESEVQRLPAAAAPPPPPAIRCCRCRCCYMTRWAAVARGDRLRTRACWRAWPKLNARLRTPTSSESKRRSRCVVRPLPALCCWCDMAFGRPGLEAELVARGGARAARARSWCKW